MPSFEKVSDATLERQKAAIEAEQKKRSRERGGQEASVFRELHSDPDCEMITEFTGYERSGFVDSELFEASAFAYRLKCKKHGSTSLKFLEMIPIMGAIDVRVARK